MLRPIKRFFSDTKDRFGRPLYALVLVVALAFALMVILSYRFMSVIEHEHMLRDVHNAISQMETQIAADLLEPETFLGSIAETIRIMILRGESFDVVSAYVTDITGYITKDDRILSYSTFVYCFFDVFDGQMCTGNGSKVPDDFRIEDRPWYKAAVEANGEVGVTDPYLSIVLNMEVLTFTRRIFDNEGNPLGVVCLDMTLDRIREYAINTYITKGSYGILGDKALKVIAHPHPAFLGRSLREMNDGEAIITILNRGESISERKATDYTGNQSVLFARRLNNGWTMAIIAYAKDYYQSVADIARIIIALGSALTVIVGAILIRVISENYRSDERTQAMLNAMPLGANFWNKNYENIDCNEESVRMFELSGKQEYLDRFYDLSPVYQPCGTSSKLMAYEAVKKAFQEGYYRFEWMHQKRDGEPVPAEITLVRVNYRGGYIIAGYTRDLREQKALLGKIHDKAEELRKLVHWYETILDTIPFPISVTDKDMRWTFVNKATEDFLQRRRYDLLGMLCSNWGAHICGTDKCGIACVKRGLKKTFFSHENAKLQVDAEILKDLNNETAGFIEIVQDITELEEITTRQIEAETANRAKSAFLARVSHEIRTPMNAILSIAEIQLQTQTLSPDTEEALGKIYNSGYLLLGIINDILDLSKIEAGKLELTPVNYDVPSLINDTVHLNVMRYDSKPIEFNVQVDENIPTTLFGDELRIKQILNNLLSNAFKYTDAGDVVLSVDYEHAQQADQITLIFRISDTGQGMNQEQVSKLFDEYTRFNTTANRTTVGTGLGMSITRHLIHMMDGEIVVESEPGKGSVFTVRLPQKKVDDSVLGKEVVENLRQFRLGKMSQMQKAPQIVREYMPYGRVLVVDDVETNLYVAKGLLAPYGLSVETATSGFETIEKIKNGAIYDIVFMDHFMPKMDGVEATKEIRSIGYTHPIIALTANALVGQAEMFQANGFDGYISKPIDLRQLNASLNKLIRDKHLPEEVTAARRIKDGLEKHYAADSSARPLITELAGVFSREAGNTIAELERIHKKQPYGDDDIQSYVANVQAMVKALANIGEMELSGFAQELEQAGQKRNTAVMTRKTPLFLDSLRAVVEKIKPKEVADAAKAGDDISDADRAYLDEQLLAIQSACAASDKKTAKETLIALKKKTWPRPVKEQLNTITEHLLHNDFAEAANACMMS